ncbi:NAD(P)/FAD-dependent oxidoreductase [Endozoicomonas arenosclerae]|uniref:NAD(P)/FAD-dependent oxidoreductase n=1 Tax=Endozoicomonas arenosclerae TaxID=1633495 RepID=UPI00155FF2E5|nr:NAD(P)/FAD-dependent oxidoreductase [Endozoicomonas arenosclerae]
MSSSNRIIIIGGGISGLSAALWCHRLGLSPLILEQNSELGGQLHQIYLPLVDYPGFQGTASELLQSLLSQIHQGDIPYLLEQKVERIDYKSNVVYANQQALSYSALIMATGNRKRELPLLSPFIGSHVHMTATGVMNQLADQHVAIIGGGDGAFENALLVAPVARKVSILIRATQPRARQSFVEQAIKTENISLYYQQQVQAFLDDPEFRGLQLTHTTTGEEEKLACDQVIIKCGYTPALDLLPETLPLPDSQLQISDQNVWIIGDVRNPVDPCLSVCVGEAAKSAREICRYLNV